jgi:hypothetical protein
VSGGAGRGPAEGHWRAWATWQGAATLVALVEAAAAGQGWDGRALGRRGAPAPPWPARVTLRSRGARSVGPGPCGSKTSGQRSPFSQEARGRPRDSAGSGLTALGTRTAALALSLEHWQAGSCATGPQQRSAGFAAAAGGKLICTARPTLGRRRSQRGVQCVVAVLPSASTDAHECETSCGWTDSRGFRASWYSTSCPSWPLAPE